MAFHCVSQAGIDAVARGMVPQILPHDGPFGRPSLLGQMWGQWWFDGVVHGGSLDIVVLLLVVLVVLVVLCYLLVILLRLTPFLFHPFRSTRVGSDDGTFSGCISHFNFMKEVARRDGPPTFVGLDGPGVILRVWIVVDAVQRIGSMISGK